jgi:ATP-dependent DNA helicase RecG
MKDAHRAHMKLNSALESCFPIDGRQKEALARMHIETVRDLLYHFPTRYTDISEIRQISTLQSGETATVLGTISKLKTKKSFKSKVPMGEATLEDLTGTIHIVWFHQPYVAKMLTEGMVVRVTGKISDSTTYGLTLTNPEIKPEDVLPIDMHNSLFQKDGGVAATLPHQFGFPVYAESKGITSKWIYHTISKILKHDAVKNIVDYIPADILKRYNLPELHTALVWIHMPKTKEHADIARKRFAFEEVFFIQLARLQERAHYDELYSYKLSIPHKDIEDFISRFPFTPTKAQTTTITAILDDFQNDKPMSRLIEGDVGSGKTFVAATVAYAVIKNRPVGQTFGNIQVAYMAPTEVLAVQLFENFIEYFRHTGVSIALITSSGCRKFPSKTMSRIPAPKGMLNGASATTNSNLRLQGRVRAPESIPLGAGNTPLDLATWTSISRNQLLKWIKNGEIPIVIGTHSLIAKSVEFEDLGLVIIDEQHRFGTSQRMKLAKKEGHAPHYLSMTATPIPRTLALTIYGDLDLSIIDQMPSGRKKVITTIVAPNKRNTAYESIRQELRAGRQAYVICPRIDPPSPAGSEETSEPDFATLQMKNVTTEAKRLSKEVFPEYRIGIMHSKMTKQKKEDIMQQFKDRELDILVSTSVIEVGVNVPNATSIIIEGAERFGLAQLHQLRGRVIRSTHQSYCYLFASDTKRSTSAKATGGQGKTMDRLKALVQAKNGFELAELDLALRGSGMLSGEKQWGITDLGMEAIKNIKMVEAARAEAKRIIADDRELSGYPHLAETLRNKNLDLHFE